MKRFHHSMSSGTFAMHARIWAVAMVCAGAVGVGISRSDHPSVLFPVTGDVEFAHDPSAIREGNTWYVFATGRASPTGGELPIRTSNDLIHWKRAGRVFEDLPNWIHEVSPRTRDLWAPDVSFEDGKYKLYYAFSVFGKNTSGIGLATNLTLDPKNPHYAWKDEGLVTSSTIKDDFNAIDPNLVRERSGREWLSFGSFWTGIKLREIDPKTGKLLASNPTLYSLASRATRTSTVQADAKTPPDTQAIEAPFIVHHGKFYYLFVSWDLCCRGIRSTYRTMVGRSKAVTGPYIDRNGVPMVSGGGTEIIGPNSKWASAGGESVVMRRGAPDLIFFHAYDKLTGRSSLQVATIDWQTGWPQVAGS